MSVPIAIFSPGPSEMMIILVIAVLLFGKRLPEVGRSLGKGIVEFKRGIRGVEDEVNTAVTSSTSVSSSSSESDVDDHDEATAPKFEPPSEEPKLEAGDPERESVQA